MPRKIDRPPRFVPARPVSFGEGRLVLMPELIGTVLAHFRRRLRVKQTELAERLLWPQSMLSKLERGEINPTVEQLDTVVAALDAIDRELYDDELGLVTSDVMNMVEDLVEGMSKDGYAFVWSTGRLWPKPEQLLRGRGLARQVIRRWPE
ncbi:MAG: helix-turn-helix transcriptional regulator [Alphaproteobacteria bacterium]|nr:helix-turn-helix transcriptional regulator [Alphaproteobacteria bacterium]